MSKTIFRIQYYLTRKPYPQKMQSVPLAVILLMLGFQVSSSTYLVTVFCNHLTLNNYVYASLHISNLKH